MAPADTVGRAVPIAAWTLAATGGVLFALTCILVATVAVGHPVIDTVSPQFGLSVLFPVVGALVVSRHPRNAVGWLFIALGLTNALVTLGGLYGEWGFLHRDSPPPLASEAMWLQWLWPAGLGLLVTFPLLVFPDGRLPSSRWRWAGAVALAAQVVFAAVLVRLWPLRGPRLIDRADRELDPAVEAVGPLFATGLLLLAIAAAASVTAVVVRFRRASGEERFQMKWFLWAAALVLGVFAVEFTPVPVPALVRSVTSWAIPLACGIAILKHRLFDIDLIVRRSLLYVGLTACVVTIYVVVVAVAGSLLGQPVELGVSLVGTAAVAVVFAPLRRHLQIAVDRLVYGHRRDPYSLVSHVARHVDEAHPATVLPSLAETVAETLKVAYVAVDVGRNGSRERLAVHGKPSVPVEEMPLTHQGEPVGWLVVGTAPGDRLSAADRRLLQDLARHVASTVRAVQLAEDLQRSREHLIAALEEERRRLGRDLHDGLGPSLAAVRLKVDAVRRELGDGNAAALLADVKSDVAAAIADIRRLVYQLRPPELDQFGLVSALREQAGRFSAETSRNGAGLRIEVDAKGELDGLPASVELAAFRIASEAMTNVVRHAGATRCDVRIRRGGDLIVEVVDDGRGVPDHGRRGVGLESMTERVAELGGRLTVERAGAGGTRVRATLPLAAAVHGGDG